jgi:hypothetical protein
LANWPNDFRGGLRVLKQLIIGSTVIIATVAIQAEMFALMTRRHEPVLAWTRSRFRRFSGTAFITFAMLMVLATMTIEVWLWAFVLLATGAVSGLEPAVYFALVCFTTLGFGDITLPIEWRLLSALIGANGFLMFGWSTAFMVELIRKSR